MRFAEVEAINLPPFHGHSEDKEQSCIKNGLVFRLVESSSRDQKYLRML